MKKKMPITPLGMGFIHSSAHSGAINAFTGENPRQLFAPHRPMESKPDNFKPGSNITSTTLFTSSSSNGARLESENLRRLQQKPPIKQRCTNVLDVFDNLDLSSSSSSDSAEFRPTGSRIQIGRIKPPSAEASKPVNVPFQYSLRGSAETNKQQKTVKSPIEPLNDKPIRRPLAFLKANRPPSRHKTPPKALGLDLPETPHTPPKTQKELEEYKEYSQTINLKGINLLNKEKPELDLSSDDSFSSIEEIQDCDDDKDLPEGYASPEIIISHNGKQINTPRTIPLVPMDAFGKQAVKGKNVNPRKPAVQADTRPPDKLWDRPGTVSGGDGKKLLDTRPPKGYALGYGLSLDKDKVGSQQNTVTERGIKTAYAGVSPQAYAGRVEDEVRLKDWPVNPQIPYLFILNNHRGRRLLTSGKLRSNTVACHPKPQSIPFDTGLDAEFLNLFAKD